MDALKSGESGSRRGSLVPPPPRSRQGSVVIGGAERRGSYYDDGVTTRYQWSPIISIQWRRLYFNNAVFTRKQRGDVKLGRNKNYDGKSSLHCIDMYNDDCVNTEKGLLSKDEVVKTTWKSFDVRCDDFKLIFSGNHKNKEKHRIIFLHSSMKSQSCV